MIGQRSQPLPVHEYGTDGPWVVLVHGGPGAGGYLAPLAHALAGTFRVLEPLQRGSGAEPLTVASHVADLEGLLRERCPDGAAIVGHSWGAMLALAHAAAHPVRVRALALVACGTFDRESRARMHATMEQRTDNRLRREIARLEREVPDPDQRLRRISELMLPLQSHELVDTELVLESCDARASQESWSDMLRLQHEGHYPSAFAAIKAPAIMLHGAQDPHPGRLTEATLRPYLPQLEYREWDRCGHYPWLERALGDEFVQTLRQWLTRQLLGSPAGSGGTRA